MRAKFLPSLLLRAGTALVIVFLLLAAWPQTASAQGPGGDKFVLGGTYTLRSGETLAGDLFVFGGSAEVEDGATVEGNVVLMGGSLVIDGVVEENVSITGGSVSLGSSAVVEGDVNVAGGNLTRDPGAVVEGDVNLDRFAGGPIPLPGPNIRIPQVWFNFNPLWDSLWFMLRSFMWAALAILVVLFLPANVERTAQTATRQPLIAAGLGLLTVIVFPLLMLVLFITLIGIPAALIGILLLIVVWGFGVVSLGTEVGRRLAALLNQDWALPVSAGVGTLLFALVINGIGEFIPCVGWVVPLVAGALGIGAVMLTRFGTQPYPPDYVPPAPYPSVPPTVPPASPEPEDRGVLDQEYRMDVETPRIPPVEPGDEAQPGQGF